MKKAILGLFALAAMAACTPVPQTAEEMRSVVKSGAFMSDFQSHKISRSYSAVASSIRQGTEKCFNRNIQTRSSYSPGPGMAPVMQVMNLYYSAKPRSTGSRMEVPVHRRNGNGKPVFGMEQQGIFYLIDVAPASGGTQIDLYGGKMGYGAMNKAVLSWARGGAIRCPDLV
ncbi:hypothetical protein GQ651_05320 [Alphaproteobacteria bacterium GH1-50]|uniref:3D (Asp-Asp-Asp) domain-containing protein n=1 Tax=Kangsaoukella pontilimi TaxID=2691042 RepID=A0A7C9J223_9RHOB|nr:hypothetical protein [Kangsaoukella pontilimi]MXQ07261.1 hypothetical protein [Kangsaoukella pontilimi]